MASFEEYDNWQNEKAQMIARVVLAEVEVERLRKEYLVLKDKCTKVQLENTTLVSQCGVFKTEVERLRAVSDELQGWRDRAVASCIKRKCDNRDKRVSELEAEVKRLHVAKIETENIRDENGQLRAMLETARSIGASPTARFVRQARALHLYREDMDRSDVEAMAGEYVAMAMEIERLRVKLETKLLTQVRLPTKVTEIPYENGIKGGYNHGWTEGWNIALKSVEKEILEQGFEVEQKNTGTAPPVQTQGLEDSPHGQSASEDQRVSGSLSRGDQRDERHQSRGRTPGGARGEAESDSGSGRTVGGDRSNAAPAGRDEPRKSYRPTDDVLKSEGAHASVCAPSNTPALPDNADPGDEAQPASPTDEDVAHAYASHLREANAARVILEAPLLARIAELEKKLSASHSFCMPVYLFPPLRARITELEMSLRNIRSRINIHDHPKMVSIIDHILLMDGTKNPNSQIGGL